MLNAIILAGVTLLPFALGQTGNANYAIVRGTVTTGWPQYSPIPYARVIASSNVDEREVRADAQGRYVFLSLLPGDYRLYAGRPGVHSAFEGTLLLGSSMDTWTPAGREIYSASSQATLAQCYEAANKAIEVSAGLEYSATIALRTNCRER
jgi:hypothetical protein